MFMKKNTQPKIRLKLINGKCFIEDTIPITIVFDGITCGYRVISFISNNSGHSHSFKTVWLDKYKPISAKGISGFILKNNI